MTEEVVITSDDSDVIAPAWPAVVGHLYTVSDLSELLGDCEQNPTLRAALMADALSRLKETLQKTESFQKPLNTPVTISLADAAMIARFLLGRLR